MKSGQVTGKNQQKIGSSAYNSFFCGNGLSPGRSQADAEEPKNLTIRQDGISPTGAEANQNVSYNSKMIIAPPVHNELAGFVIDHARSSAENHGKEKM